MRAFFATLAVAALCISAPASARTWTYAQIDDLERAAEAAPAEGLPRPSQALDRLALARHLYEVDPAYGEDLDGAADALFQRLAEAYARGRVDPATVDADWHIERPPPPDMRALAQSIDAGVAPSWLLMGLLPDAEEYRLLRGELARLTQLPEDVGERDRISQLRANLERWRWLPRYLPLRRVEVRLAQFELYVHRGNAAPVRHAVIVGARRTPSPVFTAEIESVTLNPDWDPPASIVVNELLPRFRRNPAAARREGFEALDGSGRIVDDVDWSARPFPYRLRQRPGEANALGRLRIDLPNPYAVYLHDTPNRRLFARDERALSHGCIRVENPVALAAVLMETPEWDEAGMSAAIETGVSQTVPLAAPAPIYVLYLTAVAQSDGSILYSDDIYRRDSAIVAALGREDTPVSMAANDLQSCPASQGGD